MTSEPSEDDHNRGLDLPLVAAIAVGLLVLLAAMARWGWAGAVLLVHQL